MIGYCISFIICFIFSFFFVYSVFGFYETYKKFKGTGLRFERNGEYARYIIMFIISIFFGGFIFF